MVRVVLGKTKFRRLYMTLYYFSNRSNVCGLNNCIVPIWQGMVVLAPCHSLYYVYSAMRCYKKIKYENKKMYEQYILYARAEAPERETVPSDRFRCNSNFHIFFGGIFGSILVGFCVIEPHAHAALRL